MDNRYNILKLVVAIINIGYFLFLGTKPYALHHGIWWRYLIIAVIVLLISIRWVSFARKNENLWAFIVTLIATIPFNIRAAYIVSIEYLKFMNLFSSLLYGIVICMSLLSVEEILVGVLTRVIWRNQDDVFYIEEED